VRVLRRFKRDRIRIKFSRLNIYARDAFVCQYDGRRYASRYRHRKRAKGQRSSVSLQYPAHSAGMCRASIFTMIAGRK